MNPIALLMRVTGLSKVAVIGGLVTALILALGLAKCAYDRSIIANHEANQDAANTKADRKADSKSAEQRRADDARLATEKSDLERITGNEAQSPADRRRAYYECVRRQQAAGDKQPARC